ncbi:MAG: phage portal protein [Pseudomonadota bacterium]
MGVLNAGKAMVAAGAKALRTMRHPGRMIGFRLLARTRFDYRREVGDCLDASVVTAPVQWLQRSLPEARLAIRRRQRGGKRVDLTDHPLLALIQAPNPYYGDIALWFGTVLSWCIDGNAYWLKVRNGVGRPVELWWVPWWMIEPVAPHDGSDFISHYLYTPGGGSEPMRIDPADVVHFRHGINPRNLRKGLSPIDGAIREIFADLESSNFVAALLRNMGVPGVVISPKNGAVASADDVDATKAWFREAFGGDQRGGPLVMGAPTDVQPYGFNPQQMNMSEARDIAEERICACLGVPAAVVGFGAGLQSTKVGATMAELRKLAWHNGVLPMARALVDELKRSMLGDFGDATGMELYFNTDDVLALQEEEDKQEQRWNERLKTGGITVYDWRQALGMDADDSHRIYLRPINVIEVPEGVAGPPAKAFGAKAAARPSAAAIKRGLAYARMLQSQERGLQAAFEKPLNALFARMGAQTRAAAERVLKETGVKAAGHKADDDLLQRILELLGIDEWQAELTQAYGTQYLTVAEAVQDAAERAGLGVNLPDPVARAVVAAGGRRAGLVDLDQQSRDAIFAALAEGRAEGEGVQQLANRIALYTEAGPWNDAMIRARIIARTETKFAQNFSTIQRGLAAGVTRFIVFDGRFGLPRSTLSHIERDGSIVDPAEALEMAETEHPNGTLSFAPSFEE